MKGRISYPHCILKASLKYFNIIFRYFLLSGRRRGAAKRQASKKIDLDLQEDPDEIELKRIKAEPGKRTLKNYETQSGYGAGSAFVSFHYAGGWDT